MKLGPILRKLDAWFESGAITWVMIALIVVILIFYAATGGLRS